MLPLLLAATVAATPAGGVWLKGDLHVHSRHSQDSSNNPVAKIVRLSEAVGMDYLCITDHDNHVGGDVAHHTWSDPEFRSDKVLLLYCAEWTTARGHGTTISAVPYDHQRFYDIRDARDVRIAETKRALGVHLSANHPTNGNPWQFTYDMVDSLEVWNSAIWSRNLPAVHAWDALLKSGRHVTGRGGSDSHHGVPDRPELATRLTHEATENNVGTPTTWVFARARTRAAVVEALGAGRVSVSSNPSGPRVELTADTDGDGRPDAFMGDFARGAGRPVSFRVTLTGPAAAAADYRVKVVKDGAPFATLAMTGARPEAVFTDAPPSGRRSYYRVEVEGPQPAYPQVPKAAALSGAMVALSNPIYFNFDPTF